MNVLSIFDQRISAIFEEGAPGQRKPFSFKRLAKRAVREMEDETFVIDGIDTAPALYTVLVSANDDALMRPMYVQLCDEISQLVEAQAKKRGYTFVGRPLVRFMVDPALRNGRFSVFAENIDPRTLARLRDEENAYLGVTAPHGVPNVVPAFVPVEEEEPAPIASEVAFVEDDLDLDSIDEVPEEELPTPAATLPDVESDVPLDEPEALAAAFDEPAPEEPSAPLDEPVVPSKPLDEPVAKVAPIVSSSRPSWLDAALDEALEVAFDEPAPMEEPIASPAAAPGSGFDAEKIAAAATIAPAMPETGEPLNNAMTPAHFTPSASDIPEEAAIAEDAAAGTRDVEGLASTKLGELDEPNVFATEAVESVASAEAPEASFDVAELAPEPTAEPARKPMPMPMFDAGDALEPVSVPKPASAPTSIPAPAPAPAPAPMPMPAPEVAPSVEADFMHEIATTSRNEHEVPNASERTAAAEAQVPPTRVIPMRRQHDTCTLTDVATGRTYQVIVRRTPIGRERVPGGIVLHDPNVSRRHAELVFENGLWQIRDLNSTNGTLVDDMDVREAILTDGDVITIGLTNLEFKAG